MNLGGVAQAATDLCRWLSHRRNIPRLDALAPAALIEGVKFRRSLHLLLGADVDRRRVPDHRLGNISKASLTIAE